MQRLKEIGRKDEMRFLINPSNFGFGLRLAIATSSLAGSVLAADSPAAAVQTIEPKQALIIGSAGGPGRRAIPPNTIAAEVICGSWKLPKAGDKVKGSDGREQEWTTITAGKDGTFSAQGQRGAWVFMPIESDGERVMILEAVGHTMAYFNGEARVGDPYSTGWTRLPVLMHPGTNELLMQAQRGGVKARLVAPKAPSRSARPTRRCPTWSWANRPIRTLPWSC